MKTNENNIAARGGEEPGWAYGRAEVAAVPTLKLADLVKHAEKCGGREADDGLSFPTAESKQKFDAWYAENAAVGFRMRSVVTPAAESVAAQPNNQQMRAAFEKLWEEQIGYIPDWVDAWQDYEMHADQCGWKMYQAIASHIAQPELTVWEGPMPESNGRSNFTAILMRKGIPLISAESTSMTIARSEYPERVRYEADCMRYLIGELNVEPFILDYDTEKHSGYAGASADGGHSAEQGKCQECGGEGGTATAQRANPVSTPGSGKTDVDLLPSTPECHQALDPSEVQTIADRIRNTPLATLPADNAAGTEQ